MEIEEILKLQRSCMKKARKIAKRVYRKYDRIWTQRIGITEKLEKTGLVGEINGKMPTLLLRSGNAPDIEATAQKYGFADGAKLARYLANYEPRKNLELRIYSRLLEKSALGEDELEIAKALSCAELAALVRECEAEAREITEQAYEKYDEVWAGQIKITWELKKHGSDVICEINRKMPNLLTHDPGRLALDQVAMINDFETSQELVDWLLAYEPRGNYQRRIADGLISERLGLADCEPDEVPFC